MPTYTCWPRSHTSPPPLPQALSLFSLLDSHCLGDAHLNMLATFSYLPRPPQALSLFSLLDSHYLGDAHLHMLATFPYLTHLAVDRLSIQVVSARCPGEGVGYRV